MYTRNKGLRKLLREKREDELANTSPLLGKLPKELKVTHAPYDDLVKMDEPIIEVVKKDSFTP